VVAWDGESEVGGIGLRRAAVPLFLGAIALSAGWTAVWALGDQPAQLPASGPGRDASYGPLAMPWTGPSTGGGWQPMGPAPITHEICCGSLPRGEYGNASGRITSLVVDPADPRTVYVGSAGGGVWKSVDGGNNWLPLTDTTASLAIGALAIDSTGRILYAGTGEDNHAEDALAGAGILKSTDAGRSWALIGAQFAGQRIGGLAIDRTVAGGQRVVAATSAGLYLSTNGGGSWSLLRAGGTLQIIQDPNRPERWWASQSDFCASERGAILTSLDRGISWSIAFHSPARVSRIGLGVGPGGVAYVAGADCGSSDPPSGNLIYVEKTLDGGATWASIPLTTPGLTNYFRDDNIRGQGYYDNLIAVDPHDPNHAIFGGVTLLATRDGGASFTDAGRVYHGGAIHPDVHAAVFTAPDTLYVGTDGGIWQTHNLGGTGTPADWTNLNSNLGTVQFFEGTALDSQHFLGGTQDNGSVGTLAGGQMIPSPSGGGQGRGWSEYYLSDGGYAAVAGATIYVEGALFTTDRTYFQIFRGSATGGPTSFVPAGPCLDLKTDLACLDEHADLMVPFVLDRTRPDRLLAATDRVYQSLTGGLPAGTQGWSPISGRLTTGLPGDSIAILRLGPAGQPNVIVTASAFGAVFISRDAGRHWTNISGNLPQAHGASDPRLVPPIPWVSGIAIDPRDPNQLWVGLGGVGVPHLWHGQITKAGAVTWVSADVGVLPENLPLTSVVVDPADSSRVYVGTVNGALVCQHCDGAGQARAWAQLGSGLPNVWIASLTVTLDGQALVAWTHGRGVWMLPFRLAGGSLPGQPTKTNNEESRSQPIAAPGRPH
jgi:photosystem II stability/assembly factor-like uncharacterized protein